MYNAEDLDEYPTFGIPKLSSFIDEVKKQKYVHTLQLTDYIDADKLESLLEELCNATNAYNVAVIGSQLANLINHEIAERANEMREGYLGAPRDEC